MAARTSDGGCRASNSISSSSHSASSLCRRLHKAHLTGASLGTKAPHGQKNSMNCQLNFGQLHVSKLGSLTANLPGLSIKCLVS